MLTAFDRRLAVRWIARDNRIDPVELALLVSFALLSLWVLGADLYEVIARGGSWIGTDGIFGEDQLQYLAWVRSASEHLLVSNMFVLRPTPADYLQPMVAISGGLLALGVAPWLALLLWKPVALAVVFLGVRGFVHRTISGTGARRAVLAVALFGGWIGMYIDMWLPFWSWGYPFALVALGSALGALVSYQRASAAGRLPLAAALLAGLAGWLHPWQGEMLVLILVGGEAVMWALGQRPRLGSWLMVAGAAALPLAYYAALGHADPSWRLAERAAGGGYPFGTVVLWLAPLLAPAALAYRLRPTSFIDAATRIWPIAGFALFVLDEHGLGSTPAHVFLGISIPLAVLIGQAGKSIPWPTGGPRVALALLGAVAFTVPVAIDLLTHTESAVLPDLRQSNFLQPDEARALTYVEDQPGGGGVLSDYHIGVAVPAETGRPTYLGNPYWSQPDFSQRAMLTNYLLLRRMRPRQARAFVLGTGARYVIVDCWAHSSLRRLLGPIVQSSRWFGCEGVYTIKTTTGLRLSDDRLLSARTSRTSRWALPAQAGLSVSTSSRFGKSPEFILDS